MDATENGAPQRRLGLYSAAALVVANTIGAGVFTTSGFALADLRRPEIVLLAWLTGGILAMCGAVSYGALARRIPESGGEYTFLSRTVHPLAGFLAGWVSLLAGFTAPIAASALGLQAYLGGLAGMDPGSKWLATGAIGIAGLMHGIRLGVGVTLQNVVVAGKLVLIAAFVLLGLWLAPTQARGPHTLPGETDALAFAVTLVWVSFAYSGWNAAVYVGGEVNAPQRNLQRSLLLGTGIVTVVYLALNAVFLYSVPAEALAGQVEIAAISARALGGEPLQSVVSVLVAIALFTSISSMVMAGPRVYARMAADGVMPGFFAAGRDVPSASVLAQVLLAVLVVWVSTLAELLSYIGFVLGLSAAATVCGLLHLRRREGPRTVPIPGHPWVPGLFVAATATASFFMALREPYEASAGVLTVAAGLPVYWLMRRPRAAG